MEFALERFGLKWIGKIEGMVKVMSQVVTLQVNGEMHTVLCPAHETLLETLRERLELTGTKHGCELGECSACAVLVDGEPVVSCLMLTLEAEGREIETIEGMAHNGTLHPLQQAFVEAGAAQCGYCTPAMLLTAKVMLEANPNPSRMAIREAIAGNICRCTGYVQIVDAIELAAERMRREEGGGKREERLEIRD